MFFARAMMTSPAARRRPAHRRPSPQRNLVGLLRTTLLERVVGVISVGAIVAGALSVGITVAAPPPQADVPASAVATDTADVATSSEPTAALPEPTAALPEPLERGDVRVHADLRYKASEGKSGLCDVYLPTSPAPAGGYPVVMAIHGGGWMSGDKWTMSPYCENLARRGFAVIDINYRLAPEHKFPAQADDVRDALVWLASQRDQFNVDLDALGLFGYSAGGHLAALVGLLGDAAPEQRHSTSDWAPDDPRWKSLPRIDAVCVGGPPCDFRLLPQDNTALAYFLGGSRRELPEVYRAASPTEHVSAGDPPVQIIHGERDLIVPIAGSQAMHEALQQVGVDSRFHIIDRQGHLVTFLHPRTNALVIEFFQETLQKEEASRLE